jgi:hypothetical protein
VTTNARFIIALVCLVGGIALFVVASITHDPPTALAGSALTGPVIGYAFGDRNGEKRAASALAEKGLDPQVLALLEQAVQPRETKAAAS